MNSLQIKNIIPMPTKYGCKYKGIAFDGCYFYITCPNQCKIIKYDLCFCEIECYEVQKTYTCICYDPKEKCFWAATNKHYYKLFKLDLCFNEIDFLSIHPCKNCGYIITGVSYDCCNDLLIIAFTNCIISCDKSDNSKCKIVSKSCGKCNMGISSISPSYIATTMIDHVQSIEIYNNCGKLKQKFKISEKYTIESIVFYACSKHCKEKFYFYILASKNGCYSYLLECVVNICDFKLDICCCNYLSCNKDCDEKHFPKLYCDDLIESIALEQAALSHILNAEGEKLQKIIACTDDVDKILCANKAINETIVNVTHLEIILHDKLATIKEHCHDCPDINNPCHCNVDGSVF